MELLYADIIVLINKYFLPFCRLSGLFLVAPIFSSNMVNKKLRLMMALVISLPLAFSVPPIQQFEVVSITGLMLITQQVIIGMAIGFVFSMVTQAFIVGGQVIAMQSGLGFASMVDPGSGVNVPVVSQLYLILTTLIFMSLNGHLLMLDVLAKSFHLIPISVHSLTPENFKQLVDWGRWIFSAGVLMALPCIIALLVVNFSFGIMARAAPQLNIFAVGFPVTLSLGLFVIFLNLSKMLPHIQSLMERGFGLTSVLLGGPL